MDIKDKLKSRRKALGLTMLEVANKVGVSEATVSRWESGDIANMRRDKIVLLAEALSTSVEYLMGWATRSEESELFIENLTQIIQSADRSELEEAGIDLDFIDEIIDGTQYLTFDIVCELTDILGESIDEMIGRESSPEIMEDCVPLHCVPTENTLHITRRTGARKKYILSDGQTDLIEGMLEQMPGTTSPINHGEAKSSKNPLTYGAIAAEGGKENRPAKKKPKTT